MEAYKGMKLSSILSEMEKQGMKNRAPVFRIKKEMKDPFRILIFTMLSSRTKDNKTLEICKRLFLRYKTANALSKAKENEIKKLIFGVAFHNQKAGRIIKIAKEVSKKGVPRTFEKMIKLPGVGRKTANVVLASVFGKDTIGVDVHLHRISNRLGLVNTKKPEKTEERLKKVFPKRLWKKINISFVGYGQTICRPVNPKCNICKLNKICRYFAQSF
ncbi:MAG: endonuclease III [Candidatus Micrarchaeota archaeon]|nr:endonuclease III [Candidatus Micrarchaeota archaeon]